MLKLNKDDEPAPHRALQDILSLEKGPGSIKTLKRLKTLHNGLMQWTHADPEKRAEIIEPDLDAIWTRDYPGEFNSYWEIVLDALQETAVDSLLPLTMKIVACLNRQRPSLNKALKARNRNDISKSLHLAYSGALPPLVKMIGDWLKKPNSDSELDSVGAYLGITSFIYVLAAFDADLMALKKRSVKSNRTSLFQEIFTSEKPINSWIEHLRHECEKRGRELPEHWFIRALNNSSICSAPLSERERQEKYRLTNGQKINPKKMNRCLENLKKADYIDSEDTFVIQLLYFVAIFACNILEATPKIKERAPSFFTSVSNQRDISPLSDYKFMLDRARESRARIEIRQ